MTDALKPMLARMKRRPDSGHRGDEDGTRKKRDETDSSGELAVRSCDKDVKLVQLCVEAHPCRRFRP